MNNKIPALLAMDLEDPESNVNAFAHECFLDFLVSKVPENKLQEILNSWEKLETDEEQVQFLKTIDPEFLQQFQEYLTAKLADVIETIKK